MRPSKKAIYSGLAAAGLVAGAAGIAAASSGSSAPATANTPIQANVIPAPDPAPADSTEDETNEGAEDETNEGTEDETNEENEGQEDETGENEESPDYTSSVTAEQAAEGVDEADENAALAPLATVTADEATAAASASQPGTVLSTELENENGNVVYSVVIDTGSGMVDVKVDAGNASVLGSDSGDDGEENEADEATELVDATTGG